MATKTICDYVDSLLSTWNPSPPFQNNWSKPSVHPCKLHYLDLSHDEQCHDYVNLLNTVQRHTRCSTNYCLKHINRMNLISSVVSITHLISVIKPD